jgi:hypothetical protein
MLHIADAHTEKRQLGHTIKTPSNNQSPANKHNIHSTAIIKTPLTANPPLLNRHHDNTTPS